MPVLKLKKKVGAAKSNVEDQPGTVISFPAAMASPAIELTEDAVAEAFAQDYGDKLRFDHTQGKWFVWDGSRWKKNETKAAFDYARRLIRKHRKDQPRMASKGAAAGVEYMAQCDQRLTSDNIPLSQPIPGQGAAPA